MHRATLSTTEILLDEVKHEATIQGRTVGITKSNEECFWSQTATTQQPELTNSSDYAIRFTNCHRFIVFHGIMLCCFSSQNINVLQNTVSPHYTAHISLGFYFGNGGVVTQGGKVIGVIPSSLSLPPSLCLSPVLSDVSPHLIQRLLNNCTDFTSLLGNDDQMGTFHLIPDPDILGQQC